MFVICFFFFKQKTAYEMRISDWSSDVCSSDLVEPRHRGRNRAFGERRIAAKQFIARTFALRLLDPEPGRGIALRVEVDDQGPPARRRERGRQIDRGRRLAADRTSAV